MRTSFAIAVRVIQLNLINWCGGIAERLDLIIHRDATSHSDFTVQIEWSMGSTRFGSDGAARQSKPSRRNRAVEPIRILKPNRAVAFKESSDCNAAVFIRNGTALAQMLALLQKSLNEHLNPFYISLHDVHVLAAVWAIAGPTKRIISPNILSCSDYRNVGGPKNQPEIPKYRQGAPQNLPNNSYRPEPPGCPTLSPPPLKSRFPIKAHEDRLTLPLRPFQSAPDCRTVRALHVLRPSLPPPYMY